MNSLVEFSLFLWQKQKKSDKEKRTECMSALKIEFTHSVILRIKRKTKMSENQVNWQGL